jgi:hypothetical protein
VADQATPIVPFRETGQSGPVVFGRVPRPDAIVDEFVDKPAGMGWSDQGPRRFAGVVLHRVQGHARFTAGHFRNLADPHGRDALTDWGVDAAAIYSWNDPDGRGARRSPWASDGPGPASGDGAAFERAHGPGLVNRDTEAIEIDGFFDDPLDAATLANLVALIAWRVDAKGRIPWHRWPKNTAGLQAIYWHDEFQTEKPCPGRVVKALTPLIVERVGDRLRRFQSGGVARPPAPVFPGLPAAMPAEVFARLFPEADPAGPLTRELLAWCAEVGFVPRFNGRVELSDGTFWWDFNPLHLGSDAAGKVWRMAPRLVPAAGAAGTP